MYKRLVFFVLLVTVIFSSAVCSAASSDDLTLIINQKKVDADVNPMIINDRTMVPVRILLETLGADVEWNDALRQVVVMSGATVMIFTIGSSNVYIGGNVVKLDAAPVIVNSRTLVPLRFISENLGYKVDWDADTRTVYVSGGVSGGDNSTSNSSGGSADNQSPDENNEDKPDNNTGSLSGDESATKPVTNSPKATLNKITFSEKDEEYVIKIDISEKVSPKVMRLDSPHRIVFDFYNVEQVCKDSEFRPQNLSITEIRWAEHDEYTRLVVESAVYADYDIDFSTSGCTITVHTKKISSASDNSDDKDVEAASPVEPVVITGNAPVVVIDAGHGGFDSGATGEDANGKIIIFEKEANLDIALRVEAGLKECGINVLMTRTVDKALGSTIMEDLVARADFANKANADLFVSIHNNAFTNPEATGTCVLYAGLGNGKDYGITSQELAQNIQTPLVEATALADRGIVANPGIVVLRRTNMPAALVECAFVTCPKDQKVLLDEKSLDKIADAICKGIVASLKKMGKIE